MLLRNLRVLGAFVRDGAHEKEASQIIHEVNGGVFSNPSRMLKKVPSVMVAAPEMTAAHATFHKKNLKPAKHVDTRSRIGKVWEVDINYQPTAKAPYPPLIMDFINKHLEKGKDHDVRELKLSDLKFWHGLPHLMSQFVSKALYIWYIPNSTVHTSPTDGSLDCLVAYFTHLHILP
eukprot:Gregarina_sp_Poly_1__8918@NODE_539_length_7612_cov_394_304042_g426_i0_p6_GENE_NODE_539_length_7612_cov_394_304042_g426_i0NODE_539_length_7612_cov_394_304042_g426_i0_p6_ORF_typecomplete_len176_score18_01_NODE_539_length_7612_cov_394_304042_g426_i010771604